MFVGVISQSEIVQIRALTINDHNVSFFQIYLWDTRYYMTGFPLIAVITRFELKISKHNFKNFILQFVNLQDSNQHICKLARLSHPDMAREIWNIGQCYLFRSFMIIMGYTMISWGRFRYVRRN